MFKIVDYAFMLRLNIDDLRYYCIHNFSQQWNNMLISISGQIDIKNHTIMFEHLPYIIENIIHFFNSFDKSVCRCSFCKKRLLLREATKKKYFFVLKYQETNSDKKNLHKIFGLKEPYFLPNIATNLSKKQRLCQQCQKFFF